MEGHLAQHVSSARVKKAPSLLSSFCIGMFTGKLNPADKTVKKKPLATKKTMGLQKEVITKYWKSDDSFVSDNSILGECQGAKWTPNSIVSLHPAKGPICSVNRIVRTHRPGGVGAGLFY